MSRSINWRGMLQPWAEHVDVPLLKITVLLMLVGLMTVFSATWSGQERMPSQLMNMTAALGLMFVVARIPPQRLMQMAWPMYLLGLVLLVLVMLFGIKVNGAKRWLSLGFTRIQPSEIMKIAMPLAMAWYFHHFENRRWFSKYFGALLILLIPSALIAKQPDLGTAILVFSAGFYVIFLAGLSWWIIGGLSAAAIAVAPFAWHFLHDYQQKRILTLIDPTTDPLGSGYHIIQSTIAIGSGGVIGKGYMNGTQAQLEFIPEKHTDFIFAVFGEEWGLIGNVLLVVLYGFLIERGLRISLRASTTFNRLLAGSITMGFFTYAFVNMGMVSGILPVVGVPLPFISYGGTALVTLCTGLGILMSIETHRTNR